MKKCKQPEIGDVIQFPYKCFAPYRSGWNGWTFRVGIIEDLVTGANGSPCALVRWCKRLCDPHKSAPIVEAFDCIKRDCLFEYNLDTARRGCEILKQAERDGQTVTWDEDTALLVNNGII